MSVKNVYLKKKIEGTIYDIYPHTDAGIVEFTRLQTDSESSGGKPEYIITTVYDELTALRTLIADTEARILGLTDEHANDTIIATYDTIREIASYLSTNGDAIATINSLNNTVGDASSGLVKRVTDLETATSSAGGVYVVNSITADSASDNALYIVLDKEELIDQP